MKRLASTIITLAAASAFVFPAAFPNVVEGCSDSTYRFDHSGKGAPNEKAAQARADFAKAQFCKTAKING